MKAIQFEVWTECNVGCRYCYLYGRRNRVPFEDKMRGLLRVENYLKKGDFQDYDTIAIIGGEFLQGQMNDPRLTEKFFGIMELEKDLINKGKLKSAWLSASLTHESKDGSLQRVLEMFKDMYHEERSDGFWLITSYDPVYRFTDKTLNTWKNHMKMIKSDYPNIRVNTTSILTQVLIEDYLQDRIHFREFCEEFGTSIYLKPPHTTPPWHHKDVQIKALPLFYPKRKDFLNFLVKMAETDDPSIFDRVCNLNYRADALYRTTKKEPEFRVKGTTYEISVEEHQSKCGHIVSYAAYSDSDACMLCDKKRLLKNCYS